MKKTLLRLLFLPLIFNVSMLPGSAQQACQPPPLPAVTAGRNIFTEAQEMDLGDAVAEHLQREYRVISDEEVIGYLRGIGEKIIKHLPPSNLRFQFFLFDINDVNAFTLPGGRIYVSRKMIAFAQNEDELAGVIAHELGHIVARHSTNDMTVLFREVLGVTEVSDRRDIFDKYNRLIENAARNRKAFEKLEDHEEGKQNVADLVGLYAMVRAGYDPQAQAALWDRYHQLKGRTGGFMADLFGRTRPEQKRLREMLRTLATLPPECLGQRATADNDAFKRWQANVTGYTGLGRKESLSGLLLKRPLTPPLRSDINHLRFSPDGKLILAQDDSGINVLSRQPLASLFRIEAIDARPAQFTPDSRQIVFHTPNLRVELWDIEEEKLHTAYEMVVRKSCLQTALSPDGKVLACLDSNLGLVLFDVATGNSLFEKKSFTQMSLFDAWEFLISAVLAQEGIDFGNHTIVQMAFSPDAHYFVAGDRPVSVSTIGTVVAESESLIYDLTAHAAVPAKGDFKKAIAGGFAFVGSNKILARNFENPKKSGLYALPTGEPIENFEVASAFEPVSSGDRVLIIVAGKPNGLLDLQSKKLFSLNQRPILDAYDDVLAAQSRSGDLGLSDLKGGLPQFVSLPQNPLGRLYAVDVSPDFNWLALSGYSRGAVWNLGQGKMVFYLRGFRGAYIDQDGTLYADFPKFGTAERNIGQLNLTTLSANNGPRVEGNLAHQYGAYLVQTRPAKKGGDYSENVILEVSNAKTLALAWSMPCPKERPRYWLAPRYGTLTLLWPVTSKAAAGEIKANPELNQQLAALKEKAADYLIKVLDVESGAAKGELLIATGKGSFRIVDVTSSGDWVVVSDSENRTLIYSLKSGQQKGKVFGTRAVVSDSGSLLAVQNEDGVLTLYDLITFQKRQEYRFASPISVARFSPDGKRLLVLTANQTVYLLDVSSSSMSRPG